MTESANGRGSAGNGDLSRLFSPDGMIDPGLAQALSERLSVDQHDGRAQDPRTEARADWAEPDLSGLTGLAPVDPQDAFPGMDVSLLKTGLPGPELEPPLGAVGGEIPSEPGALAPPGAPGYYFAPSPTGPTQDVTATPPPLPAAPDPTPGGVTSLGAGLSGQGIELALGQLTGHAPTESGAFAQPGDPGYYFVPSMPGPAQGMTAPPVPMDPMSLAANPAPSALMPSQAPSAPDLSPDMLTSLRTGIHEPEIDLALGQLAGEQPSESQGQPAAPPGYYFLSSPPKPSEETTPEPAQAPLSPGAGADAINVEAVRRDFPILEQRIHGQPLVWLDNAATTQKPQTVIDRMAEYYAKENSNVHRGAHTLAARATEVYEEARATVQRFLGAGSSSEIIFVRGTTEAVNLVSQSWGGSHLGPGDEILLTTLEHHSNIVPWQFIAAETGAQLRVIPISDTGEILLDQYGRLLGPRTRLVAMTHVSNALGTIVPVREMADMAHRVGARVLVDGAQAVAHFPVDVQELGADFYAFSGHKLFAPTGIGVLYGRRDVLEEMPPWQGGGSMIEDVTFERTTYAGLPQKFEAGTPIIAGAAGLGAAIDYLERLGLDNVARYERELTEYASAALETVPGLVQIGTAREKVGVFSFVMEGIPTEQLGRYLDQYGIAVRSGHHCAQPTLRRFGLEATVRPSLALYNTVGEVDLLVEALKRARTAIR